MDRHIDFEWSVTTSMSIYADEAGTPELIAAFLQQYPEQFHPTG